MYTKTKFTLFRLKVLNLNFLKRKLIWNPHVTYNNPSSILQFLHLIILISKSLSKCYFAALWHYNILRFFWCRKSFSSEMKWSKAVLLFELTSVLFVSVRVDVRACDARGGVHGGARECGCWVWQGANTHVTPPPRASPPL